MTKASVVIIMAALCTACRQDMHDQPRYKPLAASTFFPDGRSARPIPAHTVARGELDDDDTAHSGWENGDFAATIPLPVTMSLLQRGQQRFDIFCSPCHGRLGDGHGMVAQRGFHFPADLASDRVRELPPGYIFQVISNGYGGMGDYGDQIPDVNDRWAIVAYLRALQLSRSAAIDEVPPAERAQLEATQ
jgi:mono/diheme cytochrome c family protein